jgi:hypothetical protein
MTITAGDAADAGTDEGAYGGGLAAASMRAVTRTSLPRANLMALVDG